MRADTLGQKSDVQNEPQRTRRTSVHLVIHQNWQNPLHIHGHQSSMTVTKFAPSCDEATEQHDFSSQSARGVHCPAWETNCAHFQHGDYIVIVRIVARSKQRAPKREPGWRSPRKRGGSNSKSKHQTQLQWTLSHSSLETTNPKP